MHVYDSVGLIKKSRRYEMYVDVNNISMFCEVSGEGRPLILVHGNGEDHEIFDKTVKILKDKFTCYAVDSRGHGLSSSVKEYHYTDMARDMKAFMEKLDLRDVTFVGFSDGGIIGLLTAMDSDRITNLIVCGANMNPGGVKKSYDILFRMEYAIKKDPLFKLMFTEPDITVEMLGEIKARTLVLAGSGDLIREEQTTCIAESIRDAKLVILEGEDHGSYVVHSEKLGHIVRAFALPASEKMLPHALPGFRREMNVRDLGGYTTVDGRKVRKGLLIRCAAPGEMNAEEVEAFAKLGIVSLMDFRSGSERGKLPDPIGVSEEYYPISAVKIDDDEDVDLSPAAIVKAVMKQKGKNKVGSLVRSFYVDTLFDNDAYRKMFELLLDRKVPMAFHCTAGKDRTGVAAILILLALGVDSETVREDYVLTNTYRRKLLKQEYNKHKVLNRVSRSLHSVATLSQGVFPETVDAIYEAILKKYGDFDTYFAEEYGLGPEERARLRFLYTTV